MPETQRSPIPSTAKASGHRWSIAVDLESVEEPAFGCEPRQDNALITRHLADFGSRIHVHCSVEYGTEIQDALTVAFEFSKAAYSPTNLRLEIVHP